MHLQSFDRTHMCEAANHVQQYLDQELEFHRYIEQAAFDPVRQEQLDQHTIAGKARILNVATQMLLDTTLSCMTCQVYNDAVAEGCPNADILSYINQTLLS